MNGQDKQWVKLWRENTPEIRDRIIGWRKQTAIIKLDHPSRIARAHRLGYKAKQGIIVVRSRVGTGGMRRQRPRGGRRPKHLGVTRIKADVSMKEVAENRVCKCKQKYFQFMLRQRGRVLEALYLLRHLDAMGLQELLQTNSAFHPCK